MNRTGGNARRLFRWTLAVGTGVFWSERHRNPAPGIVGPFISPWSTRMTGVVAPEKKVSWTFTMVNQRGQSSSVKPWTHPFPFILTPLGGGKPIVRGAAFPKLLTIPAHQSRHWLRFRHLRLAGTMRRPAPSASIRWAARHGTAQRWAVRGSRHTRPIPYAQELCSLTTRCVMTAIPYI